MRTGACLCGAVRYRLIAEPLTLIACHCTDCQRRTGSAFGLSLVMPPDAVELTQGVTEPVEARTESGVTKRYAVCAACRTQLWGISARNAGAFVIRPGTLDDKSGLTPVAHIWTRSAQSWMRIPEGVAAFETQPEDPRVLAALWREKRG
jgi:hypothetical protein